MKRFLKNSIPGALIGFWIVLHFWISGYYLLSAMILRDRETKMGWVDFTNSLMPNCIELGIGLSFLLIFCGMLLSFGWFGIERKYRFDPLKFSSDSIKWALRVILKPVTMFIFIMTLVALIFYEIDCNYLFVMAALIVLPFGIFKKSVVKSERGEKWWLPKWPGIGAVASVIFLVLIGYFPELSIMAINSIYPPWGKLIVYVFNIIGLICGIFWLPAIAAVMIHKLSPGSWIAKLKNSLKREVIGPILALNVRFAYFFIFMSIPIIAIDILWIFAVPIYTDWSAIQGQRVPSSIHYIMNCVHYFKSTGGFIFGIFTVVEMLAVGRMIWLINDQIIREKPPNNSVNSDTVNTVA